MRGSDRTRLASAVGVSAPASVLAVVVLAVALLVAGCSHTTTGRPIAGPGAGPTEPSFPTTTTARPPTTPPSTPAPTTPVPSTQPTKPGKPAKPSDAIPLAPDSNGYVFIETKSGRTRCQISADTVGCEAEFTNSPLKDGQHANGVNITSDGKISWILGNLGDIPTVTLDYRKYAAQGWTIAATVDGTRFTNDRTGHGMFVSIDKVTTF